MGAISPNIKWKVYWTVLRMDWGGPLALWNINFGVAIYTHVFCFTRTVGLRPMTESPSSSRLNSTWGNPRPLTKLPEFRVPPNKIYFNSVKKNWGVGRLILVSFAKLLIPNGGNNVVVGTRSKHRQQSNKSLYTPFFIRNIRNDVNSQI